MEEEKVIYRDSPFINTTSVLHTEGICQDETTCSFCMETIKKGTRRIKGQGTVYFKMHIECYKSFMGHDRISDP